MTFGGVTVRPFTNTVAIHEATFDLARNDFAVLRSGKAKIRMNKTEGLITVSKEYRLVNGIPLPTKSVTVEDYSSPSSKLVFRRETSYNVEFDNSLQPADFSLSHFGLPEPPGVKWERPTPTYVWLLLAAGGFGILTLGCRWLLKRRAKAVPPATPPVG